MSKKNCIYVNILEFRSDMTSMPNIQTDIADYGSEILFLKYCVVPELFKIMSYLANFRGLISDPLGLILDP